MTKPQVHFVTLSPEELATQQFESHNLQHAIEALHRDGLIVLKNAIDPAHLDKMNSRMVPEAKELYAKVSDSNQPLSWFLVGILTVKWARRRRTGTLDAARETSSRSRCR